jgi:hypothetical protein
LIPPTSKTLRGGVQVTDFNAPLMIHLVIVFIAAVAGLAAAVLIVIVLTKFVLVRRTKPER